MAQHGFDLTDFGENWPKVVGGLGLTFSGPLMRRIGGERVRCGFRFKTADGLYFYCGNNPETGEYGLKDRRAPEKGYASYIGLKGPKDRVVQAAQFVRVHATYIKGESPRRRDYI